LLAPLFVALLSSGTMAVAADAKASKYYEDALIRYEKRDLDGAVIQLKNALQIDKSMLPVQILLGKALLQNGDVEAAEVAFLEAIRLGVNRAEVVIPLGQSYMAQGKHRLIFKQPTFNVGGLPGAVQLQLQLLRAAASADFGDVRNAIKSVEEARAIDSRDPAVWLAEVPIRIRARQFKEAAAAVDRALGLAPESAEVWYQKGSVAHVSGDLQGTLAAYTRAIKC
jgi:tetratricopeptide (TPR) repeat protein